MTYKTYEIHDKNYPRAKIIVNETDHDFDLHVFKVVYNNQTIGVIVPDTIDDMQEIITALEAGESPIGWDNGMGDIICLPDQQQQ